MKLRFIVMSLIIVALSIITSCASLETARQNNVIRGQILECTGNDAYLCVGSMDGAEVGQEYTVYKFLKTQHPKTMEPNFTREKTGTVIITEIVDEHCAKAKIQTGEAKVYFGVEH